MSQLGAVAANPQADGMVVLTLQVEPITPLVAGGEDPATAELRPPAIRGLLRFWFRAALGGTLPDHLLMSTVRKLEADVFGDTYHASSVAVTLSHGSLTPKPFDFRDPHIRYLGYGLWPTRTTAGRCYLPPGPQSRFTLKVALGEPKLVPVLTAALWLFLTLGGLGARHRRGFGALQVVKADGLPDDWEGLFAPVARTGYWEGRLKNGMNKVRQVFAQFAGSTQAPSQEPPFSVIAPNWWELWLVQPTVGNPASWLDALRWVGQKLRESREDRSAGLGPRGYYVSKDYGPLSSTVRGTVPGPINLRLPIFGLPVPVQFQSLRRTVVVRGEKSERRASPLFIRPLLSGDGRYTFAFILFKAGFLRPGEQLAVTEAGNVLATGPIPGWAAIYDFLKSHAGARRVWP